MGPDSLVYEEGSGGTLLVAPASFAAGLNRRFPMDPASSQYFTLVYAVLDPKASELRYVAAGHPGPVRVNARGEAQSFDSTGPAIGWFPEARFEECVVPVSPGDRFYFYSDGIVEAQNTDGEFFGSDRLLEMLTRSHSRPIEQVLAALETEVHGGCGAGPGDDVSISRSI
jgi:sigma-B regulation protein RsbU (phosphoserine phosphatase)